MKMFEVLAMKLVALHTDIMDQERYYLSYVNILILTENDNIIIPVFSLVMWKENCDKV